MPLPTTAYDLAPAATDQGAGWCFGAPPGLPTAQWPRSRVNGLPMAHLFTCAVPEGYQAKGPELVAISVFQADDHVADEVAGVAEVLAGQAPPEATPFWEALAAYAAARHPQEYYREDEIGGGWAWIWLTIAYGGPDTIPPDPAVGIFPGYDPAQGKSPYTDAQPAQYLALVARTADPNVGKRPEEFPDENEPDAYIPLFSDRGEALGLDKLYFGKNHFGGTCSPSQGEPDISPCYLEFDESLGGANLGGDGAAQLDLLSDELGWACG